MSDRENEPCPKCGHMKCESKGEHCISVCNIQDCEDCKKQRVANELKKFFQAIEKKDDSTVETRASDDVRTPPKCEETKPRVRSGNRSGKRTSPYSVVTIGADGIQFSPSPEKSPSNRPALQSPSNRQNLDPPSNRQASEKTDKKVTDEPKAPGDFVYVEKKNSEDTRSSGNSTENKVEDVRSRLVFEETDKKEEAEPSAPADFVYVEKEDSQDTCSSGSTTENKEAPSNPQRLEISDKKEDSDEPSAPDDFVYVEKEDSQDACSSGDVTKNKGDESDITDKEGS